MTTGKMVRDALKKAGLEYSVAKFSGCWYVVDGDASAWFSSSLNCYRLDHKTPQQWVETIKAMANDNRNR